jgi:hypothetical protein
MIRMGTAIHARERGSDDGGGGEVVIVIHETLIT